MPKRNQKHAKYYEKGYELEFQYKNLFWFIKKSGEILNKLKSKGFLALSVPAYDFSTFCTTLPHNRIKGKLTGLSE